jgi:hypothetical protein
MVMTIIGAVMRTFVSFACKFTRNRIRRTGRSPVHLGRRLAHPADGSLVAGRNCYTYGRFVPMRTGCCLASHVSSEFA